MAERALLDLHLSTRPNGAVVAGWHSGWNYAWPRDSSWATVALAVTGHSADALRILRFLKRVQFHSGEWAARYLIDGSGPVGDGRPDELDANGWVPWATWSWYQAVARPDRLAARQQLAELWPMVRAAADATARSLSRAGLPPPANDYWEDDWQITLGTAAPLLTGLRASADIADVLGQHQAQARWTAAAARLAQAISTSFGRYGYHRLPHDSSGWDASVTFLGPPFGSYSSVADRAVSAAGKALTLPDGGMLPGTDWPGNRTTAWTAETAFFALSEASVGKHGQAAATLRWLASHCTSLGALPEKVNAAGRPVSVAPLAWTDAAVLLALVAQERPLPSTTVPPASS